MNPREPSTSPKEPSASPKEPSASPKEPSASPDPSAGDVTPDVLDEVAAWCEAGRGVALATVTTTWGSSPRPAGSLLGVDDAGQMVGSVSGGCVEGAVVETALDVIASGRHALLDFGVSDERAWEVGLACGGRVQVFVDRVTASGGGGWLARLQRERAGKRPAVLAIDLTTGTRDLVPNPSPPEQDTEADAGSLLEAAREALRDDTPRLLERPEGPLFLQPFNPPLRLVIVGAVHIAQPLSRMARELGYAVTVVDPRGAFASEARFPGIARVGDWPDEALTALAPDARTAVVTLSHDPKLDDPALAVALRSPAFYVGSLGSRRTQARRLERLTALGLDAPALARIHGPVGLDIGARSPAEIAVSILAQITARLRERAG